MHVEVDRRGAEIGDNDKQLNTQILREFEARAKDKLVLKCNSNDAKLKEE